MHNAAPAIEDLLKPISIEAFSRARSGKSAYRAVPINHSHELSNEGLVNLAFYGLAGQAYYSRPNGATGQPVPGVRPELYLRKSVAEKLAALNRILALSEVAELLGGTVELFVQDAYRDPETQKLLYEQVFPHLIKEQFPYWSEEQVFLRRNELIGVPSVDMEAPAPHVTGGAVDITLRFHCDEKGFVRENMYNMAHGGEDEDALMDESCNPDYCEDDANYSDIKYTQEEWAKAKIARRILINGAKSVGLYVNPTEYWHYGYGDQLSSYVASSVYSEDSAAFFSITKP